MYTETSLFKIWMNGYSFSSVPLFTFPSRKKRLCDSHFSIIALDIMFNHICNINSYVFYTNKHAFNLLRTLLIFMHRPTHVKSRPISHTPMPTLRELASFINLMSILWIGISPNLGSSLKFQPHKITVPSLLLSIKNISFEPYLIMTTVKLITCKLYNLI